MKEQGNKPQANSAKAAIPQHKRLAMGEKPTFTGQTNNQHRPTGSAK